MRDIAQINHSLISLSEIQGNARARAYVESLPITLAVPQFDESGLKKFLSGPVDRYPDNVLPVIQFNRAFLLYARLISIQIVAGDIKQLLVLRVNMKTARILAELTEDKITLLATRWPGKLAHLDQAPLAKTGHLCERALQAHGFASLATLAN